MSDPEQNRDSDGASSDEEEAPLDPAAYEQLKQRSLSLIQPRWIPAPAGSTCPRCSAPLERTISLMMGPYSGAVRCTACPYRNSLMNYLGSKIFQVEPLPPGALPVYDRDPGEPTEE